MKYILIVWFATGFSAGMTSAEFNTKDACESAKYKILSTLSQSKWGNGICTEKGIEE